MLDWLFENLQVIAIVGFADFAPKCVSKRIIVKICTTRKNLTNSGVTSASYSSDIEVLGTALIGARVRRGLPVKR